MVMIPATVSNNIPGSDLSIGSDTALNAITDVSVAGFECMRVFEHMSVNRQSIRAWDSSDYLLASKYYQAASGLY